MEGFLGEKIIDKSETEFALYEPKDWAMLWIEIYGQIDGDHHKAWVLDQVARILKGTKIIIKLAEWENGHSEYRFDLDKPSQEYLDWVKEIKSGEDGPETYDYDLGIAP